VLRVQATEVHAPIVANRRGARGLIDPLADPIKAVGASIVLKADSLEEASDIARRCPTLPYGVIVEIAPGTHSRRGYSPERAAKA